MNTVTYTLDGKKYTTTQEPYPTGPDNSDVKEGETYYRNYTCVVQDSNGNSYDMLWEFEVAKGTEDTVLDDESNLPWDEEELMSVSVYDDGMPTDEMHDTELP